MLGSKQFPCITNYPNANDIVNDTVSVPSSLHTTEDSIVNNNTSIDIDSYTEKQRDKDCLKCHLMVYCLYHL